MSATRLPVADSLTRRSTPLSMPRDDFRALGHQLVDLVADRLAHLGEGPVSANDSPAAVRALLDAARGLPAGSGDVSDAFPGTTTRL